MLLQRKTITGTIMLLPLQLAGVTCDEALAQPQSKDQAQARIELLVTAGEVRCAPPKARLPAMEMVEMQFSNHSSQSIAFVAPQFFDAATITEADESRLATPGRLVAPPNSEVRISLRPPAADEYGYSCHLPDELLTPASSGFLVVGPEEAEAVDIPPLLDDDRGGQDVAEQGRCPAAEPGDVQLTESDRELPRAEVQTGTRLLGGPDPTCEAGIRIPAGGTVKIIGCDDEWCRVSYSAESGYVPADVLEVMPDLTPDIEGRQ
jgi:hypothetical protein